MVLKKEALYKSIIIMFLIYIFNASHNIYAYTENFEYILSTVGIPKFNVYGESINEDVYKAYNIFAYGNIDLMTSQRWKDKEDGRWARYVGVWNGSGIRGEYDVLGRNYSGGYVTNQYFPNDGTTETTPDKWNYLYIADAMNSWNDIMRKQDTFQFDYMKNENIMFDGVKYNISANNIGLHKCRLETASTWKTNGTIYVNRLNNYRES